MQLSPLQALTRVLSLLHALYQEHLSAHWQSSGDAFYADHLLFQRMYEKIPEEIDALAEKMMMLYGPSVVNATSVMEEALLWTRWWEEKELSARLLQAEKTFQKELAECYEVCKQSEDMSLGLDDFLMGLANDHETHLYLLGQKFRAKQASQVTIDSDAYSRNRWEYIEELADFSEQGLEEGREAFRNLDKTIGGIRAAVLSLLGGDWARKVRKDGFDWVQEVMDASYDISRESIGTKEWDAHRKLWTTLMSFQDALLEQERGARSPREEYRKIHRTLIEASRKRAEELAGKIRAATQRIPTWSSTAPLRVEIGSPSKRLDDTPIEQPAGVFHVYLGDASFTVFLDEDTGKMDIDDMLDVDDMDFFDSPGDAADYINLIKELKKPGSTQQGKRKVLYTARPTKDRQKYLNGNTIPVGVFLTSSENDAEGLASDLGGSELRDLWRVVINEVYLVQTLDGYVKHYQVVGKTPAPVEQMDLIAEGGPLRKSAGPLLQFPDRMPTGPKTRLLGKDYLLSDYFPMMGEMLGEGEEEEADEGGARLVDMGGNRFRYLWAHDTEKGILAMWRVSDGDNKVSGRSREYSQELAVLNRKRQLNVMDHAEFIRLEREMGRKEEDAIRDLQHWLQENESLYQKTVNQAAWEFFRGEVEKPLRQALAGVEQGAIPLGFKVSPSLLARGISEKQQAKSFMVEHWLVRVFTPEALEEYLKDKGLFKEGEDIQASYFAVNDVRDEAYSLFS